MESRGKLRVEERKVYLAVIVRALLGRMAASSGVC